MSEREPRADIRAEEDEERALAALLRGAGPRPELPADDLRAIAETARSAWRFQVRRRRRRHIFALAASLAALLAVAVAVALWTAEGAAPLAAAELEAFSGRTLLRGAGDSGEPLAAGASIPAGSALATAPASGSAALRLSPTGTIVRLDRDTQVRIVSARELDLERGALYVDTGDLAGGASAVAIRTPFGVARDVGTQFSVRLLEGETAGIRVRIRTGAVAVEQAEKVHLAPAGEELMVSADGTVERRAFASDDPGWDWVLAAAPPFAVEGRTLAQVLRWACREAGWRLQFEDTELERDAEAIVVRGGIGALRADQAPFAVLPGAGLEANLEAGVLTVRRPG